MSSPHHDTQTPPRPQEGQWGEEDWVALLQRLPQGWQEQAIELKAWQRTRKVACVSDLLRALLVYAACGYSFRQLGIWATLVKVGSLSERAWRKRVERAQEWITWLVGALIGSQQRPGWLPRQAGRILLVDATRLKWPGGGGEDVKLHCAYDLLAGRLTQVQVQDRHSGEGLHHFCLQPGDVVVTDAGYHLSSALLHTEAVGAFGVHRLSAHQVRLEREDGQKIDLKRLLKHQKYGTVSEYRVWVWDALHRQRYGLRLILALLPRQQAMKARARKRERLRRKQGPNAKLAAAWWAGAMLLGTTLPAEQWSAQEVVKLYRARWQIELLFKRLKQGLQVHLLPVKVWERARTYVQLCVLVWWLHEQEAAELSGLLLDLLSEPQGEWLVVVQEGEERSVEAVLSHTGVSTCVLETVRMALRGSWSRQRVQECLPQLRRYLVSRPRPRRPSQEAEVQLCLRLRFAATPCLLL